jgi:hypothetical protein
VKRKCREPAAPSAEDEWLSIASLRSSPWVLRRIKELQLQGRLVKGWTPQAVPDSFFRPSGHRAGGSWT